LTAPESAIGARLRARQSIRRREGLFMAKKKDKKKKGKKGKKKK